MATAARCGYSGTVTGVTGATEITYWEVTEHQDAPDATSMSSSGWHEFKPCLFSATGMFRSLVRCDDVGSYATVQFLDDAGGYHINGTILVSNIEIDTPVDGLVSYTHTFTFTGTFTVTMST